MPTIKQHTIKKPVSIDGVGLHTGMDCHLTFKPAPENHGYKFQRVDLPGQPVIDADVDYVVDTSRGTTLEHNGCRINTVEHVLAALAGMEVDNVLIQLDGPEPPIMDGSSKAFVDMLLEAKIVEQDADREYFMVPENVHYAEVNRKVEMVAMPVDDFRITVMVDYNSSVLGSQHASVTNIKEFEKEIASCRTFCFLHELEMLLANDLIKGGDLNNAIVIVDRKVEDDELDHLASLFHKPKVGVRKEGILNNVEMRFQNEPARHKLLDLIGDLALIGMPIKAQIMAARPGHAANVAFAKKIKALIKKQKRGTKAPVYNPNNPPVFDITQIQTFLPHRHPFLLVDKIIEKSDKHIVAIKNISFDEYFFPGHFPNEPVFPGVLQIEAMAQAGGVMILSGYPDPENYITYFMKIDSARFKDKVIPGDTLVMKLELTQPVRRGIVTMKGSGYVGDRVVVEAEMMAQIVKKVKS
jgi:UDP-3-O-[3-hydroxymyristoyl] N-acetylglucosamine deacetylase/3-hydroxyacyl-[acyl-carrier-protein] dehydratase